MSFSNPAQWFNLLFGFDESPEAVESNFTMTQHDNGDIVLTSKVNNKSFSVGNFQVRYRSSFDKLEPVGGGTLNLFVGDGSTYGSADIITSETHPSNHGATFQIASNFNCLDHIPHQRPPHGRCSQYVTRYEQGGPGTVACGPALIYRQYLYRLPNGNTQLDDDVNLLEKTPAIVSDGYIQGFVSDPNFDWSDPENYAVGVHQNIDVTLGRDDSNYRIVDNQRIHQVFCSTASFALNPPTDATIAIVQNILNNMYELTILAAWENSIKYPDNPGSKRCFLTLVGGGVFRNPIEMIGRAISRCADLIVASGLTVYVVCFSDAGLARLQPHIAQALRDTDGQIIRA